MMETEAPHLIRIIQAFNLRKIPYLLIGGEAVVQYGSILPTKDHDFWIDPDHRKEATSLLRELGYEGPPESEWDKPLLRLFADWSVVDLLSARNIRNLEGTSLAFDECLARAKKFTDPDGSFYVYVPCLSDLIALKKMRPPTPKDLEDLRYLEEAQKREQERIIPPV
ncbi:MAG: hypothetical protein HYU64_06005 [Armatimonadetes bacterium]|nr:hypothetical protein [Armatimonadota bacterium]